MLHFRHSRSCFSLLHFIKRPPVHAGWAFCIAYPLSKHHHLYNTAAWRRLRGAQLRAQPLCRMHAELGQLVAARVVDHIERHDGDRDKFGDAGNLQSLCKSCHDSHKQAQERNADGILRGAGLTGQPLDLRHPWHQAGAAAPIQGGGGQKSEAFSPKTASDSFCAKSRKSGGGIS
jgi:5-methylcytosine-specific restriction protein A